MAAFAVIALFMVVEVVGGVISGSLALLADAAHMMTDAFALALAASAHWMSAKPANQRLHFGYRRVQVLAAFVNGIALVVLMTWIVYEAVRRAINPIEVAWLPMLIIALIGLGANGIAFRLLHSAGGHNINIRGAMLHVASDLLGSIAAVIAAVVIAFTGATRIDPILSLLVAALIGRSAVKLIKETTHILLEGAPSDLDVESMASDLSLASPGIENIHSVRIWQLTPDQVRLTLHARIRDGAAVDAALKALKTRLEQRYGIAESTIQIESASAGCPDQDRSVVRPSTIHVHSHEPARKRQANGANLSGADAEIGQAAKAVANLRAIIK
jgi:cobalt-zinc-cadmium efflux system protein